MTSGTAAEVHLGWLQSDVWDGCRVTSGMAAELRLEWLQSNILDGCRVTSWSAPELRLEWLQSYVWNGCRVTSRVAAKLRLEWLQSYIWNGCRVHQGCLRNYEMFLFTQVSVAQLNKEQYGNKYEWKFSVEVHKKGNCSPLYGCRHEMNYILIMSRMAEWDGCSILPETNGMG